MNGNSVSSLSPLSSKAFIFTDNFLAAVTNLHTWLSVEILTLQELSCKCYAHHLLFNFTSSFSNSYFDMAAGHDLYLCRTISQAH
jgi:hypothetical protein